MYISIPLKGKNEMKIYSHKTKKMKESATYRSTLYLLKDTNQVKREITLRMNNR